jgi:hypothetical protein
MRAQAIALSEQTHEQWRLNSGAKPLAWVSRTNQNNLGHSRTDLAVALRSSINGHPRTL